MTGIIKREGNIADFLASYGGHPDWVYIDVMTEGELNHILTSCRKARFSAYVNYPYTDTLLPTLRILGPRVENIEYYN